MMAKKPKADTRVWLPKRSSRLAREVDVALQLVSRAAAGVEKAGSSAATIVAQALVIDGLESEFADDTVIGPESAGTLEKCEASVREAALALINELGATTPCVNTYLPPYPDAVRATELKDEAALSATLDKGSASGVGPRTWVLAPVTDVEQPAVSLSLLEGGVAVVCAIALPKLPRNSMDSEKLLRMTVSFDGQSGAVTPPEGTLMWAEEFIGSYERAIGGEHGTDVRIRADRSLLGRRDIASGQVTGVQDLATVTRCEIAPQPRASSLASELGMTLPPLQAGGPFAYGLIARGEAQTYFDLPDAADAFDSNIWSHVAGALLVHESGGMLTDTVGNALDFSQCRDSRTLPAHVVGVVATNKDLHADVLRKSGLASIEASAA